MTRAPLVSGLFAATLTWSAALLFVSEPMIARMLLPVAGGAAAVWTTCLVFFQIALLGGYLYAHVSARRLTVPLQVAVHVALLAAAFLAMSFDSARLGAPPATATPIPWLLRALATSVGPPFLVLAATTPLAQSWFAGAGGGARAYILYSASNFGSFAGLIAYPALIEPRLPLAVQSHVWTVGYLIVCALIAGCGAVAIRAATRLAATTEESQTVVPSSSTRLRWIALAAVPSSLTLSVTTFISTDIAAIPLIWIVPLSLYLVSFIVAFAWPSRGRWSAMVVPVAILPPLVSILTDSSRPAWLQVPAHLVTFFIVALACHQALARSRPGHANLPEFYVWLALGGALGAVATSLIAPLLFRMPLEYPIGLLLACSLGSSRDDSTRLRLGWLDAIGPSAAALLVVALARVADRLGWAPSALVTHALTFGPSLFIAVLLWPWPRRYVATIAAVLIAGSLATGTARQTLTVVRSFYGVHRVQNDDDGQFHMLLDGSTIHGIQRIDPSRRRDCVGYYTTEGPAGQVFEMLAGAAAPGEVAVLGLGAGSLACYAERGQRWTFFEIDPAVAALARTPAYFTYLSDSPTPSDLVIGDARLSLAAQSDKAYDLIVVDVFSSDAIPIHLLTREAFQVYADRLAPGGRILFHISNLYFRLRPVVSASARSVGLVAVARRHEADTDTAEGGMFPSEWMLVARRAEDFGALAFDQRWQPGDSSEPPWTDDHAPLVSAFIWKR